MEKSRFRFDYVLVASLLVNAGLIGFLVALLSVPGPMPGMGRGFPIPHAGPGSMQPPDFDFGQRLFLAGLLEKDAEAAAGRMQRAAEARKAFAEALSEENPDQEEIVARGEVLKEAMEEVGDGFLDAIVSAAPKLGFDERRKLSAFLLRLPSPALPLSKQGGSAGDPVYPGRPAFEASPFGGPGAVPSEKDD